MADEDERAEDELCAAMAREPLAAPVALAGFGTLMQPARLINPRRMMARKSVDRLE
jgi:hypothetical protein